MPMEIKSDEEQLGYSEKDGVVTLRMVRDDYSTILFALGFYLSQQPSRGRLGQAIGLVNRINAGNPNFTPYGIPEEPE